MGEEVVVADEYFFGLYEVRRVAVGVNAAAVEAGASHVLAASTDEAVVEGEVVVLAVDLFHVALHHWDAPTQWQTVVREHLQHILVPEVLPLSGASL